MEFTIAPAGTTTRSTGIVRSRVVPLGATCAILRICVILGGITREGEKVDSVHAIVGDDRNKGEQKLLLKKKLDAVM